MQAGVNGLTLLEGFTGQGLVYSPGAIEPLWSLLKLLGL